MNRIPHSVQQNSISSLHYIWHYVNIKIMNTGYDAARDCQNDACVVAQIQKDAAIVGDRTLAQPVRAEALRFLLHFVGDLHQPLHAADNHDRGGNEVWIVLNGEKRTSMSSGIPLLSKR